MIRIANVSGHYTSKIVVELTNEGSVQEFYLDYENADGQWTASNACIFNITGYVERSNVVDVERVFTPNDDALAFALRVDDDQELTANVEVTVIGTHDDGVITIPTNVSDGSTFTPFHNGYKQQGWAMEVGRLQKYQDIFSGL
jgi:hypothetical protein